MSFSHYVGNRMDRIAPLLTRVDFPVPIDGEMIRRIPPYTGDSEGMFRIVFCSRLEPYRHLDLLVDAVSRLDNRMKCIIHIISDRPDYSEYYQSIVDLIYRCGLTASVRWWGDLADQTDLKMALFKHANVLVHLSTFEGETFGRVVIEAMACGLPVITTRWQALDELVKEGENGYLISVKNNKVNRSELISALERFMNDPDTGRKIGETNRNESLRYNYRHVFLTLVEKLKQLDNQSIIFSNPLTLPWSISSKI
ncbi:MAG: glycosyltransferase family 4 protein [Candidatus Delongbacteria bacterium]|nr:glycosyltransferase family 4 protein [Candidatus Delongbacteria bacterium]